MIKYGGLLIAMAGIVMPYSNRVEYAFGGVLIFLGMMLFLNAKS